MSVVDVKRGRRGTVVFCRDERGRERRVAEHDLLGWTAVPDRFSDRPSVIVEVAGSVIECAVDEAPGLPIVSGFDGAARLLGFQRDARAATLSVVAGADGPTTLLRSGASSRRR